MNATLTGYTRAAEALGDSDLMELYLSYLRIPPTHRSSNEHTALAAIGWEFNRRHRPAPDLELAPAPAPVLTPADADQLADVIPLPLFASTSAEPDETDLPPLLA